MGKVIKAEEAIQKIQNGATLAISGFIGSLQPEVLMKAIQARYLAEKTPKDLTLVFAAGQGDGKEKGLNHLGEEGLVKRIVGGHYNLSPRLGVLAMENKAEAYNLPQGTISQWFRAIAGRRPGIVTKVGLGTYVDPRIEGGKLNSLSKEDLVEVLELGGEEYLWYKPFPLHVALLRGTSADEEGNISLEREAMTGEVLAIAQAVKACGGTVIVQVERLVANGSLDPRMVKIPSLIVDYIVVANPEDHHQTHLEAYNPAYSGEVRIPLKAIPPLKLDVRKVIARRCAMELTPNAAVNLGIGMPEGVSNVANEEGLGHTMTLTVEAGPIGGVPVGGIGFGAATNPAAILDQPYQFDYYDGGGLDLAFLGLAETDAQGNINVSKFKGRVAGCGGFINITQNAKRVFFCGTFTAGGLEVKIGDGKIQIITEGKGKKFLKEVEQITFSGDYARKVKQPVMYITERAVFELSDQGMVLTEIAPGVDLEKDVLGQMDFKPIISPNLKTMDARIFADKPMGLSL